MGWPYTPHQWQNDVITNPYGPVSAARLTDIERALQAAVALFNVRDPDFGATGDGTTDDSTAIQNAIAAAAAVPGGTVYFPPGTYSCKNLTVPKGVHLIGAGFEATYLKMRPTAGATDWVIRTHAEGSWPTYPAESGAYNFSIQNLTVDGNKAGGALGGGIRLYGEAFLIANVRVRYCKAIGIRTGGGDRVYTAGSDAMEAHWTNVKVHECEGAGVHLEGPHDSVLHAVQVFQNGTAAGTGVGILFNSGGFNGGTHLSQCHVWGDYHEYAVRIKEGTGLVFTGCQFEGASKAQVYFDPAASNGANSTLMSACRIYGFGVNNQYGVLLGNASFPVAGLLLVGLSLEGFEGSPNGGAFKFVDDADNVIQAAVYQGVGNAITGAPDNTDSLAIAVAGGAAGSLFKTFGGPLKHTNMIDGDFQAAEFTGVDDWLTRLAIINASGAGRRWQLDVGGSGHTSPFSFRLRDDTGANDRLVILTDGKVGLSADTPTAPLDVNGNTLRLRTARTPASAGAAGNAGDVCWDASYIYVCIATNTWRRIAHATW